MHHRRGVLFVVSWLLVVSACREDESAALRLADSRSDASLESDTGLQCNIPTAFRAGAARSLIDFPEMPSPPLELAGGITAPPAVEAYDSQLYATAFVFSGDQTVAMIAVDVIAMEKGDLDLAKARIASATGMPASNVLINASHTHHAPSTVTAHAWHRSQQVVDAVLNAIVQAGTAAFARLEPATLRYYRNLEPTLGRNSRLKLADGMIRWGCSLGMPASADCLSLTNPPTGPVDFDFPVVGLYAQSTNAFIGGFFVASVHNIGSRAGGFEISAGLYGVAAARLTSELGAPVAYFSGAAGSTHVLSPPSFEGNVALLRANVLEGLDAATSISLPKVASSSRDLTLHYRTFSALPKDDLVDRVTYMTKYYAGYASSIEKVILDENRNYVQAHQGEAFPTMVQVLNLGPLYFVTMPGETFAAVARDVRHRSPFRNTFVLGLTNDYRGYIPDRASFAAGGYQTWSGRHSYVGPDAAETLTGAAVSLLNGYADGSPDAFRSGHGQDDYVVPWRAVNNDLHLGTYTPNGDGSFDEYVDSAFVDRPASLQGHLADVDGDGKDDFVSVSPDTNGNIVFNVYKAGTNALFYGSTRAVTTNVRYETRDYGLDRGAFIDANGDRRRDYAVVRGDANGKRHITVHLAQADGTLAAAPVDTLCSTGVFWPDEFGTDRGDFVDVNGDERDDYAVVWSGVGGKRQIAVYLASATVPGAYEPAMVNTSFEGDLFTRDTTVRDIGLWADITGDRRADYTVIRSLNGARGFRTYVARADGTFAVGVDSPSSGTYLPDARGRDLGRFADINGDGLEDYVVIWKDGTGSRRLSTFLATGTGTLSPHVDTMVHTGLFMPDALGRDVGQFSDVTGDHRADYVVAWDGGGNRVLTTYVAQPDGRFTLGVNSVSRAGVITRNALGQDRGIFGDTY